MHEAILFIVLRFTKFIVLYIKHGCLALVHLNKALARLNRDILFVNAMVDSTHMSI